MKYHLTMNRKEVLIHATTQMNPENFKLSEISHKKTTIIFLFYEMSRIDRYTDRESR